MLESIWSFFACSHARIELRDAIVVTGLVRAAPRVTRVGLAAAGPITRALLCRLSARRPNAHAGRGCGKRGDGSKFYDQFFHRHLPLSGFLTDSVLQAPEH